MDVILIVFNDSVWILITSAVCRLARVCVVSVSMCMTCQFSRGKSRLWRSGTEVQTCGNICTSKVFFFFFFILQECRRRCRSARSRRRPALAQKSHRGLAPLPCERRRLLEKERSGVRDRRCKKCENTPLLRHPICFYCLTPPSYHLSSVLTRQ